MTALRKICSECKISKVLEEFNFRYEEFNFRYKARNVKHGYCRDCGKLLTRSHYRRNKRQYLDKNSRSVAACRRFTREMKNRPCADCGVIYPYYVMDFDHRENKTKKFLVSQTAQMSINAIKREISKCDVVCANCHRERTHRRLTEKTVGK